MKSLNNYVLRSILDEPDLDSTLDDISKISKIHLFIEEVYNYFKKDFPKLIKKIDVVKDSNISKFTKNKTEFSRLSYLYQSIIHFPTNMAELRVDKIRAINRIFYDVKQRLNNIIRDKHYEDIIKIEGTSSMSICIYLKDHPKYPTRLISFNNYNDCIIINIYTSNENLK
jgi:hypothetical protein